MLRPISLIFVLSIFLSLGTYNPVYAGLLKLTKFYIFRNPSKFLFFGAFSLSILAGVGLTKFFSIKDLSDKKKAGSAFLFVLFIAGSVFLAFKFSLLFFKEIIIKFGNYYARNFIYNKPGHRYNLEYYLDGVRSSYGILINRFSFSNIFIVLSWCIFIGTVVFCLLLLRKRLRYIRYVAVLLIFIDIFIFSFGYGNHDIKGFRANIRPFTDTIPSNKRILDGLKSDKEICRILPFDIKSGKLPNWSLPNANMSYGIDSIACYTPLAVMAYRDKLSGLEAVDDSLGLKNPDEGAIGKNINTLRLLNVKYVISPKELKEVLLEKIDEESGIFLYKLKGYFPRAFFSYSIDENMKDVQTGYFKIINYKDGLLEAEITTDRGGFVILSENYYPGWNVYVDGKIQKEIKVSDMVQGVAVSKGTHTVIFCYKPKFCLSR